MNNTSIYLYFRDGTRVAHSLWDIPVKSDEVGNVGEKDYSPLRGTIRRLLLGDE